MARPKANELTQRELEVMHVFWKQGECTVSAVRGHLAEAGRDLAYTTVATLIRILTDKGFLKTTNDERPFSYRAIRTFDDVSGRMLTDLVQQVFRGSREQLLIRLMDEKQLSQRERKALEEMLRREDE